MLNMSSKIDKNIVNGYERFLNSFFIPKFEGYYPKVNYVNFSIDDDGGYNYYFDLDVNEQDFDKISTDNGDARKGVRNYWDTDVADFDYAYVTGVILPKYEKLFGLNKSKKTNVQMNINNEGRNFMFFDN